MHHLAESELIINSRGAIYHLDLRPEELADTIIVVGDQDRVAKVSKYFDRIEHQFKHREFITHTGYIGTKRISVISTGIGPDNIDIVLNEIDAVANINFEAREINPEIKKLNIVRFGTSGSLQEDIAVDSLVVSTHGLGFDNLMHYYVHKTTDEDSDLIKCFIEQTEMDTTLTMPYAFRSSDSLISKFGSDFNRGITVTAPGFYGPQGRELRLKSVSREHIDKLTTFSYKGNRITNFEMETSAIYGLGKLLGHECLSINVIVANRILRAFSKDSDTAIENMIKKSLEVLVA